MRTKRPLGVALALAVLTSPVVAGESSHEPLAWVAVPTSGPSLAYVDMDASRAGWRVSGIDVDVPPLRPTRLPRPSVVLPDNPPRVEQHRAIRAGDHPSTGGVRASVSLTGTASWFCGHGSSCTAGYPGGLYAAAGPALRKGDWRGRVVTVGAVGSSHTIRVTLIDWCACPHRLLDLYSDAFSRLAPLSRGLLNVTVTW